MGKTYIIGIDNIQSKGKDQQILDTVCTIVQNAGHTVINAGIGPSAVQNKAKSTNCDVMVQIAGGRCIGTCCDFCEGITKGYYHAKMGMIAFASWTGSKYITYKYLTNYKFRGRAWDDNFSSTALLRKWGVKLDGEGQTLSEWADQPSVRVIYNWCWANSSTELGKAILTQSANYQEEEHGSGSQSIRDSLKQLLSYYDGEIECFMKRNEVHIQKIPTPNGNGLVIAEGVNVVADSVTVHDYYPETVNKLIVNHAHGKAIVYKNPYLIERFGEKVREVDAMKKITVPVQKNDEIEVKVEEYPVDSKHEAQAFAEAEWAKIRRNNGHTVSVSVIDSESRFTEHRWVQVSIPSFSEDSVMYITKFQKTMDSDAGPVIKLELADYPPGWSEFKKEE